MTRKKSRPQHNVSPKKTNEGGFYKMFWDSMEGEETSETQEMPSPEEISVKSPTFIVINDSDDENPLTVDENSGDQARIPFPIKEEFQLNISEKSDLSHSDRLQCEKSNEDVVPVPPLEQSTLEQENPSVPLAERTTSPIVCSINSPVHNLDQTSPFLCENVVQPSDASDVLTTACSSEQSDSINSKLSELLVNTSEHLNTPNEEVIPNEAYPAQENGGPSDVVTECSQVCPSDTSQDHQIEQPIEISNSMSLNCEPVVRETRSDNFESIPIVRSEENSDLPPTLSETTGLGALSLLKSLLLSDGNSDSILDVNSDNENMDNANDSSVMTPVQIKKEIFESLPESSVNVPAPSRGTNCSNYCTSSDQVIMEDSPNGNITTQATSSLISEPRSCSVADDSFPNPPKSQIYNHSYVDEFPMYKHFPFRKLKVEPNRIFRSLEFLKSELFTLYTDDQVKNAFNRELDENEATGVENMEIREFQERVPTLDTAPCRVMMERLPAPMLVKGYIATTGKRFQSWKSRIVRQRNEEKFRHLKVWRRGRTLLWRECELAGMDKKSYDEQVAFIKKHKVSETSSSESELSDNDDNQSAASEEHTEVLDDTFEDVSDSSDESETSDAGSDKLSSSPDTTPSKAIKVTRSNTHASLTKDPTTSGVSELNKLSKISIRGRKPKRYSEGSSSEQTESESPAKNISVCRDEYVVERNTVNDELNSDGKKMNTLKITIRKTSVSKSEDEREKSVESEVENTSNFTIPTKRPGKKVKRTFVTKRTYRKPEDTGNSTPPTPPKPNASQKSSPETARKRKMFSEDDNEEESLLGRRSYEVENDNLLEKWEIPFEAPTLFRSPRVASRLAQMRNKEAFRPQIRHPKVQKTAPINKEIKDVVEMLCTKTVEAMLSPDIVNVSNISNGPDHRNSISDEAPQHEEFLKPQKVPDDIPLTQTKPTVQNSELTTKPVDEEDFSDQSSIVLDDGGSSTVDEPSKHDETLDKGTEDEQSVSVNQSPKVTRAKRKRYGYKRRKSKVKPNVHTNDTLKVDEEVNTDQTNELNTIQLPKVILSPLHSTQVPVVSEGPGQSPQESEDDSLLNKGFRIPEKETNEFEASLRENDENQNSSSSLKECSVLIPEVTTEPTAQDQQPKDVILPRVTRSKQPTITLDPDVLENFGVRKKRKSEGKIESAGKPLPIANQKPAPKSKKCKGKTSVKAQQEDNLTTGAAKLTQDASDSDSLNTQVHEVSEGPGEAVLEPEEQKKTTRNVSNDNEKIDSELASIEATKGEAVRQSQTIPDSPMSPTPDAEPVSVRITRSKKKMMPWSRYITVPSEPRAEVKLANQVGGSKPLTDRDSVKCNSQLMSASVAEENEIGPNINQEEDVAKSVPQCQLESGVKNNASKPSLELLQSNEVLEDLTRGGSCDVPMNAVPCTSVETNLESSAKLLDDQTHNLIPIQEIITEVVKEKVSELLESPAVNSSAGPTTSTVEDNSVNYPDESSKEDSGSTEPNTSQERQAVLDALNSILAVSSKTKKDTKSCTPLQTDANIPALLQSIIPLISSRKIDITAQSKDDEVASKDDESLKSKNDSLAAQSLNCTNHNFDVQSSKSKNDGSGSDGGGDLIVDDDFSDDDNNGGELKDRINRIILDQIINDQLLQPEVAGNQNTTKSVVAKTVGGKCEVIRESKEELDKPKDDGVSSHLDKISSAQKQPSASEEKSSLDQNKESEVVVNSKDTSLPKRKDSIDEKTGLPNNLIQKLRDPRIRNKLLSHFEGDDVSDKKSSVTSTSVINHTEETKVPVNEPQGITRDPRTLRLAMNDPRKKVTPVKGILKIPVDQTTAVTPVRGGSVSETPVIPKSPLLPSPVPPSPISSGTNLPKPVLDAQPSTTPVTSDSIELSDDDEESIKRRSKKSKKEIDTELMYKSPLEDLQTETRPSYSRNWKPPHPRRFSNNDPRRRESSDGRTSRWDVRHNPKQSQPDIPQPPEMQRSFNNDNWAMPQVTPSCTPLQSVNPAWNPNWFPNFNHMVYREPRMNYMETQLFNLTLLPKTTNLKIPSDKKMYTFYVHGNPEVIRIPPPAHDPNEESRTITMMDAMGQEMIDIVQLPRPTSGLTEDYFAELPHDCTLEEIVAKPYLPLSVYAACEEVDGKEVFADSDEERDPRSNNKKHVVAEKSKKQFSASLGEIEGKNTECSISSVNDNDPLKNILNCLPQLKEQYSFSKNTPSIYDPFDLGTVLTDNNGSVVTPPPPPIWTTSDVDLRPKVNQLRKSGSQKEDSLPIKNWRNPSPPKISKSKYSRRSRSKSPARRRKSRSKSPLRRRKSRSRSPDRRRRSRSPYKRSPSRRSRSRSPGRRHSWSRDYSRSRSRDRSRSPQRSRRHRSRSRSPPPYKRATTISPSRKHSRR